MAVHTELSPAEAADRLALRELFDDARCGMKQRLRLAQRVERSRTSHASAI
jgi:hypothetical protein